MSEWILVAGGLLVLSAGAELFVRGASGIATRFGVSKLLVGLTIAAYGTSAPELAVSSVAALKGSSAVSLGNVVGSNVANLGLVLGLAAVIRPLVVHASLLKREVPFLLVSALLLPLLAWDGQISRLDGMLLLCGALLFTGVCAVQAIVQERQTRRARQEARARLEAGAASEADAALLEEPRPAVLSLFAYLGVGSLGLVYGAQWLVDGAVLLAADLGVSERVIGLTLVAVGTSLPEMATSLVSAFHGELDMAVGNVVGSNIFNVFFILGTTGVLVPIKVPSPVLSADMLTMVGLSLALVPLILTGQRISRIEGALLVGIYAVFTGLVVI
ncbi:MAG: sodium:calcium antiporter [Deltaproteobacteria bacterium]|nr:MAG: sodium:calcium antiporter [Deltaproteobacteria bacterium]